MRRYQRKAVTKKGKKIMKIEKGGNARKDRKGGRRRQKKRLNITVIENKK